MTRVNEFGKIFMYYRYKPKPLKIGISIYKSKNQWIGMYIRKNAADLKIFSISFEIFFCKCAAAAAVSAA